MALREAECYYSHSRSLKSFVGYDLGMRDCWLVAHILENKLFSFSLLPPKSLIAELSAESSFCLYLMLNKTRISLLQSEFRDAVTAGHCCPELSRLLLTSFFKFWQATLMVSDLSNVLLVFISISVFPFSKGEYLFHFYLKVCLCVCVMLITPADQQASVKQY